MPITQHRNHTSDKFGTVSVNTYPLDIRAVYGLAAVAAGRGGGGGGGGRGICPRAPVEGGGTVRM